MQRHDRRELREHRQTVAERDILRSENQNLHTEHQTHLAVMRAYFEAYGVNDFEGPLGKAVRNALGANVKLRPAKEPPPAADPVLVQHAVIAAVEMERQRIMARLEPVTSDEQREQLRVIVNDVQPG